MPVQWFPGHMHATRKALAERMKAGIDVVIELLDARLPGASANPLLAALSRGPNAKPAVKILNKQDLADPTRTALWLAHYNAQPATRAIALNATASGPAARLVAACRELAPARGGMDRPLRLLICGIPNVGKSTLINTLAGRKAAKTGDEAGITQTEQRIALASDVYLYDTPGMLWPKLAVPEGGYHLAASGAVGRNAYDEQEVALEVLQTLQRDYAAHLTARYGVAQPAALAPEELLAAIARARGALRAGGHAHLQKAAEIVLTDLRGGALGRISLETPGEWAGWVEAAQAAQADQAAQQAQAQAQAQAAIGH